MFTLVIWIVKYCKMQKHLNIQKDAVIILKCKQRGFTKLRVQKLRTKWQTM